MVYALINLLLTTRPYRVAHVNQVYRLSWRPGCAELASCSEDGSLRILRIR